MDYIKARTYIDESHRFGGEMGLEAITCHTKLCSLSISPEPMGKAVLVRIWQQSFRKQVTGSVDLSPPHCMNTGKGSRSTEYISKKKLSGD